MEFVAFPLRIEPNGQLARSSSSEQSLVHLLQLMLTTPAAGWLGSPNFGMREILAELPFKSHVRAEAIRRMNENLSELGIDWAEVKILKIAPANDAYEQECMFTIALGGKETSIQYLI